MKKIFYIFLFVFLMFFTILYAQKFLDKKIKIVKIGGQDIKVELATTSEESERGLSGRNALDKNTGMLFIFPKSGLYSFWMKDMFFPIDMIWINKDLHIVYIKKNALPISYPETYTPNENAKYVLEISTGFSDKNNLKIGDKIYFGY